GVVEHEQNPNETQSYDLRAELMNLPPGLVVLNDSASRAVSVRISAPRDVQANVRPSSLRAYVDLSKATPGSDQYPVMVETPDPKMHVVDVSPPRLTLRLDETIDRQVPVRLNRIGSVPFGYEAGDATLDPTIATVTGPSSTVRTVDAVSIDFRLDSVTSNVDGRYPAIPVDSQGQQVTSQGPSLRVNPATIRVQLPVTQQVSYKTVGVEPSISGTVQSGYVIEGITTEPSAITVVGPPQPLAGVNFVATEQIDVSDAAVTFARQVSVVVPENVSVVQDGNVTVTVRIGPIPVSQSVSIVPAATNIRSGLQIASSIPSVQVVLQGPVSAVRGLQPGDLGVSLNLSGLGPGTHQVAVDVSPPPGLSVQSTNPSVLTVTLASIVGPTAEVTPTTAPTATPLEPTEAVPSTATAPASSPSPATTRTPAPARNP